VARENEVKTMKKKILALHQRRTVRNFDIEKERVFVERDRRCHESREVGGLDRVEAEQGQGPICRGESASQGIRSEEIFKISGQEDC
jgi:hypothetical protein